jgi:hypothetical protein
VDAIWGFMTEGWTCLIIVGGMLCSGVLVVGVIALAIYLSLRARRRLSDD